MLAAFKKGEKPKPGPQSGRHTSENSAGLTALTSNVSAFTMRSACLANGAGIGSPTALENSASQTSNRYVWIDANE